MELKINKFSKFSEATARFFAAKAEGPYCVVCKSAYNGSTRTTWHVYPKDKADDLVASNPSHDMKKPWYRIFGTYQSKDKAEHALVDIKAKESGRK